ncbi:MAG: hypothetical protein V1862_13955 [Methanobacteriota archaeon]
MADKLTVKDRKSVDNARMAAKNKPTEANIATPDKYTDSEVRAHNASGNPKTKV